jgi:hypothetical protein
MRKQLKTEFGRKELPRGYARDPDIKYVTREDEDRVDRMSDEEVLAAFTAAQMQMSRVSQLHEAADTESIRQKYAAMPPRERRMAINMFGAAHFNPDYDDVENLVRMELKASQLNVARGSSDDFITNLDAAQRALDAKTKEFRKLEGRHWETATREYKR